MKVLSLFDGISCAKVALKKADITIEEYYASEIDPYAITIAQKNHPSTIQLGDIKDVMVSKKGIYKKENGQLTWEYTGGIDILVGGSPCQDLSIAKRDRKGLVGHRSALFYDYLRIKEEIKPKWWILENVSTMAPEAKAEITKCLGVEPIMIDAGLVSAQTRKRLFWTNIPNITQPKDRGLYLRDIMEKEGIDITQRMKEKKEGTLSFKKTWANVRRLDQKAKTLMASGQNISNSGATNVDMGNGTYRQLTATECERLQGLPDGYTKGVSRVQQLKMLGNAFNVDVVAHILSHIPKGKG